MQTGLAFLRVLNPVPQPSWGGIVADGMNNISTDFWLIIPPGVVISLTILALGVLADAAYDSVTETWAPRRFARAVSGAAAAAVPGRRPAGAGREPALSCPA